jgi:hypothetical protein
VSDPHNYNTCPCQDCGAERIHRRLGRRRLILKVSNDDFCKALEVVLRGLPPGTEIRSISPSVIFDDQVEILVSSELFPLITRDTNREELVVPLVLVENGKALRPAKALPKRSEDEGAFI